MNWVRMACDMKFDPRIHAMASDCCKGDEAKVAGHLQFLFSEMPKHARDGDLSKIKPEVVEAWAAWRGKRGAFDKAVRQHLCTDEGVVRAWKKHNGDAIERSDRERARVGKWREEKRNERAHTPEPTPPVTRNSMRTEREVQRVDGTGRDVTAADAAVREAAAAAPDGLSEQFVDPRHRAAYEAAHRSHRFPADLDSMIVGLSEGLGAPRGKALTWHQLGQGILDLRAQQRDLTTMSLGSFAAKVPSEAPKTALLLMPSDDPGTVRDTAGKLVWYPGCPERDRPTPEQIAANGWSVAA